MMVRFRIEANIVSPVALAAKDGLSPCPIARQLFLQLERRLEPPHIAQPFDPLESHPFSVQVAVEAEEVRLDRAPRISEGRLRPLIHHPAHSAAPPLDPDRVDAVGRKQLLRGQVAEVDGRHAQQAAPSLPFDHTTRHAVRPAEQPGRGTQIASGNGSPNPPA
jgi:hypothetical protein